MSYTKTILLAAIVVGLAPCAFAIDENELMSTLRKHRCPPGKIDTTGMPNLKVCDHLEPDLIAVNNCQSHQLNIYYRVLEYNKVFEACHQHDSSNGSDLSRRLKRALEKAQGADQVNQRAEDQMLQREREDEAERAAESERARQQLQQRQQAAEESAKRAADEAQRQRTLNQGIQRDFGAAPQASQTSGCNHWFWASCMRGNEVCMSPAEGSQAQTEACCRRNLQQQFHLSCP